MSCSAGAGGLVKLLKLFVEIHRRVFLKMSMARNGCDCNGVLPASSMLKKGKESLSWRSCLIGWRRKLVFFLVLGLVATGSFWFFLMFDTGALWRNGKSSESCEKRAKFFIQQFNVSDNQLHALTTLFSESDQIASFECTREPGSGMSLRNGIVCTLKVRCLEKLEFQKQNVWGTENVEHNNQCPVKDVNFLQELDLSILDYRSFVSQSNISPNWLSSVKNISQTMTWGDCAIEHAKELYFCLVKGSRYVFVGTILSCTIFGLLLKLRWTQKHELALTQQVAQQRQLLLQLQQQRVQNKNTPSGGGKWRKQLLIVFILAGFGTSTWLFWHENQKIVSKRVETLASMCDERARMLQDQFNVSMNHVHALAILVSTFHHGKQPSAIDQKTFGKYTEKTAFERPLTSGVAYALKVLHSEREQFEKQHGWIIKKMETEDQTLVQDCIPEKLDPAPVQDEYAPVIFSQETVSHIVSIDMMSGKEDRENILRARASGKGVLTSPFKLLKSNHLGVVLTFAVYNTDLPSDATPEQRINATVGYLGASYDVPSLVEKLLHQLASKQTIVVNVYDTTNASAPISMYGTDVIDTGLLHVSYLDFGDPLRKHEMHCRFKQKPPIPWTAINASLGVLVITLLLAYIFYAAIYRIQEVEKDYLEMMELKARAEAADVAKSQFLATVSHEIRTPMNGVLGMLQMLMDTKLDAKQLDYAQTAHTSGNDLITLINDVLDQAKIESGRLEPESVPFDLHYILDGILSLFSTKANEKGIEFAAYVSDRVPDVLIGDPGRFRQIITNLVGNSFKFTRDKGHIFVTVHLADEVRSRYTVTDKVLQHGSGSNEDRSSTEIKTLSGFPVVNRWNSWDSFRMIYTKETYERPGTVRLLITVEDTGVGIPRDAQCRIFTPFMQADSSTSRTYGGTGIGLSISRCLVELMGGEIGFVSEPTIGSTFSFTVSFRVGEASSLDKLQHCYPNVSEFKGLRVLVVDDKSIRTEVTRYQLKRMGVIVDIAHNMQAAYSYLTNCDPSAVGELAVVLVDSDVWNKETGLACYQLLEKRRKECYLKLKVKHAKIFLLATSISSTELNVLKSDGIVNLQMKPIKPSFLFGCLQEAIGSHKKWEVNRKKPANPGNLLNGRRVLVVDDNKVNRRVAEGALKKYGATVTCVESGSAGIELLKPPHEFDACFMDLQMPEMDGFEATRQIRAVEDEFNEKIASGDLTNVAYHHVPILAMTADVIQATSEKCLMCGMDGYVSKPFAEEQLYMALAKFFESG